MKILEKQGYHLFFLVLLILGVTAAARGDVLNGSLWGLSTQTWLWLSILVPVTHQIFVVICWRTELHYNLLSKTFGERAFSIWSVGFMILFIARPVTILGLAAANRDTLSVPLWLTGLLSLLFFALGVYLLYSVIKYFSMERALGIDHFEPDVYRDKPFVKGGIFKWTSNAMYLFGFLLLWIPGLLFLSKAALLAALFNHLYIWVHYYFTEEPDMRFIYQLD
jgi:hypothetical protein